MAAKVRFGALQAIARLFAGKAALFLRNRR
jgi:hypothetical protein